MNTKVIFIYLNMICGNNLEQYVLRLKISLVASQCFLCILSAGLVDHGFIKNCLALSFQSVFKDVKTLLKSIISVGYR